MTLADIANFVCGKINQSESDDLTACKGFARRRFEMVWNDQLWKDSLFEYTQTLSSSGYTTSSTWLPTKQVLILPVLIARPIAVRNSVRKLNVEGSETFYRTDFDAFQSQGEAYQFRPLPPVVWEIETATQLYRVLGDTADTASVITVDTGDSLTRTRNTGSDLGTADKIYSFAKQTTRGSVSVGPVAPVIVFNQSSTFGFVVTVNSTNPNTGVAVAPGATVNLSASAGDTVRAYITGALSYTEVLPAGFNGTWILGDDNDTLEAGNDGDGDFITLGANDTVAPKRQRIQIIGSVPDQTVLRVLGKIVCPTFTADTDEAALTGVDNVLLAFTQGDMLQRERQYTKAQACYQEAMSLLEQLKKQEVVQQAFNKRIIPEDGYGNPYDLWSHPPLSF